MAAARTFYEILGVATSASAEAVRKAYKIKVLETHPDKLPPGTDEAEIEAAEARFRDVRTAFEVLSDPAKRRVYDNGLEYVRRHVSTASDMQAKLARERAEWARQAELRHHARLEALREKLRASQERFRDTMVQAELRYQERIRAMEQQLNHEREAEREEEMGEELTLADEMLKDLRRKHPEWEARRRAVLQRQAARRRGEDVQNWA